MQLALTTVGTAIGGTFGGPVGAAIGGMIGSLIGGLLDPPKMEGPRRTDKKLQRSEYGQAIPLIWGTKRVAGNVIWQPDEMTEHKKTSGGKGGPKQTTYTYSASWAVQLAAAKRFGEPAILKIGKILADGRLISENGQPTDDFQFVVYTGTEDQEPDPTIEADKGVGNVPAYRGIAYIVFTDVTLTDFGDRIPSIEVEVIAGSSGTVDRVCTFDDYLPNGASGSDPLYYTGNPTPRPGCYLDGNELVVCIYDENAISSTYSSYYEERYDVRTGAKIATGQNVHILNALGSGYTSWTISGNSDLAVNWARGTGTDGLNEIFWYKAGIKGEAVSPPAGETGGIAAYFNAVQSNIFKYENFAYALANTSNISTRVRVYRWALSDGGFPQGQADDTFFDVTSYSTFYPTPGSVSANSFAITIDSATGDLYILSPSGSTRTHELFKVSTEDMSLLDRWILYDLTDLKGPDTNRGYPANNISGRGFAVYKGLLAIYGEGSGTSSSCIQLFDLESGLGSPQALTWLDNEDKLTTYGGWGDLGNGYFFNNEGIFKIEASETLATVVEDISVISGFSESEVDVTDLTDRVYGFMVASQMTAKNAIDALRASYFFDGAEIDGQVVFKHRNHDHVAVIPDDDLAAHVLGSEPPPLLQLTRVPDHEIPNRVNFTYIDPDMNYQANTVYDERQTGESTGDTTLDVPLVFPTQIARSIASRHLFASLLEREQGTIWTSRKWERLTPTDVVVVQDRLWRIIAKRYTAPGVVEFDLIPTHPAVYEQSEDEASGISGGGSNSAGHGGSTTTTGLALTTLVLLDMPSLSQADPPFGFRAAMCPQGTGRWTGANLYKSYDNSNYQQIATTGVSDIIGRTTAGTGSPSSSGVLTVGGILGVELLQTDMELSSCSDADFAAGVNMFAVQRSDGFWNICQFQYATLIADGMYELTNIVQHSVDTLSIGLHAVGDTFVLLPAVTVDAPESDLNIAIYYKAVTYGATLGSAEAVLFINTGELSHTYYGTVANNLPVFSCDYGSPSGTRAGLVPAPTLSDCANDRILSVHGWVDATGGGSSITVKDQGSTLTTALTSIDFLGASITAAHLGGGNVSVTVVQTIHTLDGGVTVDADADTINANAPLSMSDAGGGVTNLTHDTSGVSAATYGTSLKVPTITVNATGHATTITETDIATLVGDSGSGGTKGLAPAPASGDAGAGKFLSADGTWRAPSAVPGAIGISITWGDGGDGSINFDGVNAVPNFSRSGTTYTANGAPLRCTDCVVASGVTVNMAGRSLYVSGTLSGSGTIHMRGGDASGATGGAANTGDLFATTIAGTNGTIGAGAANSASNSMGGNGGQGGANGSAQAAAAGGTATAPSSTMGGIASCYGEYSMTYGRVYQTAIIGGASGSPGRGDGTNTGGGSGAGGGMVSIFARLWTFTGTVTVRGGNGGQGAAGNVGGGGGGGGGYLCITTSTPNIGSICTLEVAGGTGGAGRGSGAAGSNGSSGRLNLRVLPS